jgi:hypothetical protein
MASIQTTPLGSSYKAPSVSNPHVSPLKTAKLLPAGPAYLSHLRLTIKHGHSYEKHDAQLEQERQRQQEIQNQLANGEDDLGVGEESESEELLAQDPKEWKVSICSPLDRSRCLNCLETRPLRCPWSFPSPIQGYA